MPLRNLLIENFKKLIIPLSWELRNTKSCKKNSIGFLFFYKSFLKIFFKLIPLERMLIFSQKSKPRKIANLEFFKEKKIIRGN